MVVRLPYGLHRAYRDEHLLLAQEWRALAATGAAPLPPIDRRLLGRMVEAIESGLEVIEPCRPDLYDGPRAELVRRVEREHPRSFEVTTADGTLTWDVGSLASTIVQETADAHPDALALRWIEIGYSLPLCQNDACEAEFEPIVRVDPSALVWHVAASLFTWAHSGVWTPPILADALRRWTATTTDIERWCRIQQDVADPYERFMAAYATWLLDGLAARHDDAWLQAYCQLVA
jgi:hypothetical protein